MKRGEAKERPPTGDGAQNRTVFIHGGRARKREGKRRMRMPSWMEEEAVPLEGRSVKRYEHAPRVAR